MLRQGPQASQEHSSKQTSVRSSTYHAPAACNQSLHPFGTPTTVPCSLPFPFLPFPFLSFPFLVFPSLPSNLTQGWRCCCLPPTHTLPSLRPLPSSLLLLTPYVFPDPQGHFLSSCAASDPPGLDVLAGAPNPFPPPAATGAGPRLLLLLLVAAVVLVLLLAAGAPHPLPPPAAAAGRHSHLLLRLLLLLLAVVVVA